MRHADSVKEATGVSLWELSRAVRMGHGGRHAFMELPGVGADSKACDTEKENVKGSYESKSKY